MTTSKENECWERDAAVYPPPYDVTRLKWGETSRAHADQVRSLSTAVPRRHCTEETQEAHRRASARNGNSLTGPRPAASPARITIEVALSMAISAALTGPHRLSITHNFCPRLCAQLDVRQTGQSAPHNDIAGSGIVSAGKITAEPGYLDDVARDRFATWRVALVGNEMIKQAAFRLRSVQHAAGLENRYQV
jgi:hypothetical protein